MPCPTRCPTEGSDIQEIPDFLAAWWKSATYVFYSPLRNNRRFYQWYQWVLLANPIKITMQVITNKSLVFANYNIMAYRVTSKYLVSLMLYYYNSQGWNYLCLFWDFCLRVPEHYAHFIYSQTSPRRSFYTQLPIWIYFPYKPPFKLITMPSWNARSNLRIDMHKVILTTRIVVSVVVIVLSILCRRWA